MEDSKFTRISCWTYNHPVPPLPQEIIVFYESKWDLNLNEFIDKHKEQIKDALLTYPSENCSFLFRPVPLPFKPQFESEEEKQLYMQKKAKQYKDGTTPFNGIIACALPQDRGFEEDTSYRLMTFNIEDCTEEAVIAAIRYMAKLADEFKADVKFQGRIPEEYRERWQVDLKEACPELYDTTDLWLSGKYDLCFTEPLMRFDENIHRLLFVAVGDMPEERLINEIKAEMLYIFYWNHFDLIRDADFQCPNKESRAYKRLQHIKAELEIYHRILSGKKDKDISFSKSINSFCKQKSHSTARSRIRSAIFDHEKRRVNQEKYPTKMITYYEMDGEVGYIRITGRDTIELPDYMKRTRMIEPTISAPGYKLSRYNFFMIYITGESIIYNPLYNACSILSAKETKAVLNNRLTESLKMAMIEGHFLVEDDMDELAYYENTYKIQNDHSEVLSLAIMPTLKCNCACPYCFERKNGSTMSDETEDAIMSWIKQQLASDQYKGLSVDWFGGEPLLQPEKIKSMSKRLMTICQNNNVVYNAAITTNGVNIKTYDDIKWLHDCQIRTIQITFDGSREAHNAQKYEHGTKKIGTYDSLLKTVKLYSDNRERFKLPPLRVRINVSDDNYPTIERLLDDLWFYRKDIVVFFRWVYSNKASHWKEFSKYQKGARPYVGIYRLQMLAFIKGFTVDDQYDKCHLRFSHCEADSRGFYTIDPLGNLYQCVHEYTPENAVGNVRDGITKPDEYTKFRQSTGVNDDECRNCKWLPMCHGGCRRFHINKSEHLCIDEKLNMELYLDFLFSQKKYE